MKVLHLLSSNHYSGAENVACQIIAMFKNSGINMIYCSPEGDVRNVLEEKHIPYVGLASFDRSSIQKAVKEFAPDIIHAHDVKASIMAAILSKRCQVISHMHVNHKNMNSWGVKPLLYLGSCKWYKHIFWVSKSAFSNYIFHNKIKNKSSILYNIIDGEATIARAKEDSNNYSYDMVYVGRITYQKNPERLLRIVKGVVNQRPKTNVAIVGTGDLFEEMKNKASELGLDENLTFCGYLNNPLKLIRQSKMLLMTSRFEGTPMTALETLCLGVPIVSTPTDGMNEIINHGENGFLSNDDNTIIQHCLEIISNPEKQKEMGGKAMIKFKEMCDSETYKITLEKYYYGEEK